MTVARPLSKRITSVPLPRKRRRRLERFPSLLTLLAALLACNSACGKDVAGLTYTYPSERLKTGQSLGNKFCYVTLDGKTDLLSDRTSVRYGLRESTNQRYYLLGWDLKVTTAAGEPFE